MFEDEEENVRVAAVRLFSSFASSERGKSNVLLCCYQRELIFSEVFHDEVKSAIPKMLYGLDSSWRMQVATLKTLSGTATTGSFNFPTHH